jgi:hypothetical protein
LGGLVVVGPKKACSGLLGGPSLQVWKHLIIINLLLGGLCFVARNKACSLPGGPKHYVRKRVGDPVLAVASFQYYSYQ